MKNCCATYCSMIINVFSVIYNQINASLLNKKVKKKKGGGGIIVTLNLWMEVYLHGTLCCFKEWKKKIPCFHIQKSKTNKQTCLLLCVYCHIILPKMSLFHNFSLGHTENHVLVCKYHEMPCPEKQRWTLIRKTSTLCYQSCRTSSSNST